MTQGVGNIVSLLTTPQLIGVLMLVLELKHQEGRATAQDRQLYNELCSQGAYQFQAAA
jgi:hypothetical protein